MENVIKVRATLVKALKYDVFTTNEIPKENKVLFFKDPITKIIRDSFKIESTSAFATVELYKMLQLECLYILTDKHNENDFCFKLVLRPADEFDFFYSPKWVKTNTIYYVRNGDEVHGPHILMDQANVVKLKSGIKDGILYVPGKQLFEPYKIKKTI